MRTMVPRLTNTIFLNEFEDSAILQLSSREVEDKYCEEGYFSLKMQSLELLG